MEGLKVEQAEALHIVQKKAHNGQCAIVCKVLITWTSALWPLAL